MRQSARSMTSNIPVEWPNQILAHLENAESKYTKGVGVWGMSGVQASIHIPFKF